MPPRKSQAGESVLTPESQSSQPRSAAHDAYMVPELRAHILSLLSKHDLTRFMRVEKQVMASVAKELYHTMPFSRVKNNMTLSTQRQKTYCAAVHTIDARNISLTPAMMKGIDTGFTGSGVAYTRRLDRWLLSYHVEVMELLLPLLSKKCANLRRVQFGAEEPDNSCDSWVVYLSPDGGHAGRIELLRGIVSDRTISPPAQVADIPPAPSGYTITQHFNLHLTTYAGYGNYGEAAKPLLTAEWLEAFKEKAYFAALGGAVYLAGLPVSLDVLSDLCQRQTDAQSERRIAKIHAYQMASFTSADFRTFAWVASSSLTHLHLVDPNKVAGVASSYGLAFSDLPEIIPAIRGYLVNLVSLCMTLRGIETAEEDCKEMLRVDCLEAGGSIQKLRIITEIPKIPLLNTLRCLSPILDSTAPDFSVLIARAGYQRLERGPGRYARALEDPELEQISYLRSLRSQQYNRRVHLATVDFASLGVFTLTEASALTYHKDGHPRSKYESHISGWADHARDAIDDVPGRQLPGIEKAIREYAAAAAKLEEMVSTANPAQLLEQAQKMQSAVSDIKWKVLCIQGALGGARSDNHLKEYVEKLKRDIGGA